MRIGSIKVLGKVDILANSKELLEHYCGFEIEEWEYICNPFREDNNPGARFIEGRNGYLLLEDHGWSEKYLDVIGIVMKVNNISFIEAIQKINIDVKDLKFELNKVGKIFSKRKVKPNVLKSNFKSFSLKELEWWKQFNWNKTLLKKFKVKSCYSSKFNNEIRVFTSDKSPIYSYADSKGPYKRYMPFSKGNKWRTARAIVEGYDQLKSSDILFITSSLKDTGMLNSIGYKAINPPSENSFKTILNIKSELEDRFNNIYVWMDNDTPGKKASIKLTEITGWNYINCPDDLPKDPSDVCKEFGANIVNEIIKEKLIRDEIL